MPAQTLTDRLLAVLDALDLRVVHLATQSPGDIAGLLARAPERIAGIVLFAPPRIEAKRFADVGDALLYIAPSGGTLARTAEKVTPQLPEARTARLDGYDAESWSDIAADRPDVAGLITGHLAARPGATVQEGKAHSGEVAGIRYQVAGAGPALVLTPLAFAASQWQPIVAELASRFRVVMLSGPHLGMAALLEQRAMLTGWRQMCAGAFDALELAAGDRVLEVGCGSGANARQFVQHTGADNPLTAIDVSPYLLGEAEHAAVSDGVAANITFAQARAEQLPYDDDAFAAAYSITVLEECDAERAIAEMIRVVRPGGRIALIVRATDMAQWWNVAVAPDIRAKIEAPAASVGPGGIASGALYRVAADAGLRPLRLYPYIVASESSHGPVFEFPEAHALAQLTPGEQARYQAAKAEAIAAGTLFMTRGHHCFVGEVGS